jgi:hypothetical protein
VPREGGQLWQKNFNSVAQPYALSITLLALNQKIKAPLAVALRAVSETKELLQSLIVSSETFDYQSAKRALVTLDRKVRELGKLQTRIEGGIRRQTADAPNVCVVDFHASSSRDSRAR